MRPRADGWRRVLQHLPSRVLGPLFSKSPAPILREKERASRRLVDCKQIKIDDVD